MTTVWQIRPANWQQDKDVLSAVRQQVFVEEQHVPPALEIDQYDPDAQHWLAFDAAGLPIGTIRMLTDGHIGRLAVLPAYRQQGLGMALLQTALAAARAQQCYEAYLYAQLSAVGFYEQAGFTCFGDSFMDADIPHITMRLQLSDERLLGVHGGRFAIGDMPSTALAMISQAQQQLRILSLQLDPPVFDTPAMEQALSILARKSRYTRIRILIADSQPMVKRGHRLLTLHRRLPSNIELRTTTCEPHLLKDNLIIADHCGLIVQAIKDPDKSWGNFNNQPSAKNKISYFDDLWERGVIDRELRPLDL